MRKEREIVRDRDRERQREKREREGGKDVGERREYDVRV